MLQTSPKMTLMGVTPLPSLQNLHLQFILGPQEASSVEITCSIFFLAIPKNCPKMPPYLVITL